MRDFKFDLSSLPKELQSILELLKDDFESNPIKDDSQLLLKIDWDQFVDLAIHHRIYPSLYIKIKNLNSKVIPEHIVDFLCDQYKRNVLQMLLLSAEMEHVSKFFHDNQTKHLYLKGPVIAKDLYGDISLRTSKDLDILIELNQLEIVNDILLKEGYIQANQFSVFNDWKWRVHHLSYFHPKKRINIEIHWMMHPVPMKEPAFMELWKRRRKSDHSNFPIYYLGREDLFLYLIVHGTRHGWFRIRWLQDIFQLLKQKLDYGIINKMIRKYKLNRIVGQGLFLSYYLFGAKINDKQQDLINKTSSIKLARKALYFIDKKVELDNSNTPKLIQNYYRRYLYSIRHIWQIILLWLINLYPSYTDYQTLPLPKLFHFLYFPLRPFLAIWRMVKKSLYSHKEYVK